MVEETTNPLWDYWQTIKRHRWLIGICALTVVICSALYNFTRIPLYTADATLLIERKAPQFLKVQDAQSEVVNSDNEFLKTQYEILKSPSFAERVIRDEGLQSDPLFTGAKENSKQPKPGLVAGALEDLKTRAQGSYRPKVTGSPEPAGINPGLVGAYLSGLEVRPVTGTSLVQIKFTTPDPTLSARLANAHVSSYVRYGIDLRSQTNDEATVFLQQKLTELKERVEQSEAALNSYRKDKGILSVDDKDNIVVARLSDLSKNLTAAEGERIALEAKVRIIRSRNYDELPAVLNNSSIDSLKGELGKLEAESTALSKDFKPAYPPLENLKVRIEDIRRRLRAEVQNQVKGVESAYLTAKTKEAELRATMEEQKKSTLGLKDSAVQYGILAREVDTNRQLYDGVLQRLKEIGVAADVRTSNTYVMGKAKPPLGPSYPDKRRTLMLGLLLGLAVGIGLAFLLDRLDNSFKNPEEAERFIRLPTLAVVPDFTLLNGRSNGYVSRLVSSAKAELPFPPSKDPAHEKQLVLDYSPLSVVSESYRSLRSSLLLSQAGGPPHTILVTSATRGEGKSTTLINAAIIFAQMGIRVLIIDADLRRPRCHALLNMEGGCGLTEVLAGQAEWRDVIRLTAAENLSLMPSGSVPPNPAELLGSKNMHELLQQLREEYEFIFVDSSPVMAVSDGVLLSTIVDGTLLVVDRNTARPLLRKTLARLNTPHTKILGTLLNRVDSRKGEYVSHFNHYYEYYHPDSAVGNGGSGIPVNGNWGFFKKLILNGPATSKPAEKEDPQKESRFVEEMALGANGPATAAPAVEQAPYNEPHPAFLDLMVTQLTEAIGPMAPLVLNDHIVTLGESSETFPETRLDELAQRVSKEIMDDSARLLFEEKFLKKIHNGHETVDVSPRTSEPPPVKQAPQNEPRPALLELMVTQLTEAIGPMAPMVLNDHIVALSESSETFPQTRLEELAQRVSQEIADEDERHRFVEEMKFAVSRPPISEPPVGEALHSEPRPAVLERMVTKLTDAIGPMGPMVLQEHILALAESPDSFPEARFEELAQRVSLEISDAHESQRFMEEMRLAVSHPAISALPVKEESNSEPAPVFLELMVAKLTRAMGPMAPLVLQDHIRALGESSDDFPKAKLQKLVKRVSQEILDESVRQQFEEEILKEIQNV